MQSAEVWQSLRGADWFSWIRLTHLTFHLGAVWNRALPTHSVMLNMNELDGIKTNLNRCLLVAYMILFNSVLSEGVYRVYTFCCLSGFNGHARLPYCVSPHALPVMCVYNVNMHECIHAGMRMNIWSTGYWPICRCEYVCACLQTRTVSYGSDTDAPCRVYPAVSVQCFYLSIVTYTSTWKHISIQIYTHLDFDIPFSLFIWTYTYKIKKITWKLIT